LIDGDNRDTAFIENESFLGTSILNKVKKDLQNNELLFGIDKIVNYDIKLDKKECPYVHVRGAYLEQIQYIPSIDFTRTISNNYNEVQKFYGLLAAKNVFYEELSKCLGTITPQMRDSLKIIVNMLSKNGEFVGINKQGLEKNNFSFLSLLSFESPMTVIETTLNPKTDTLDSVSSQLITGNF
jgi:DNA-directed RNA polymerase beta' subunit